MRGCVRAAAALVVATALALVIVVWPTPPTEVRADQKTDELFTLINRARVAHTAPPMARAPELDTAADGHSRDMVLHEYLDHAGSDGSTPQQRAAQAGYTVPPQSAWIVVEVISAISADPAGPLDWWLNQSPAVHGKVLLDPRWREMGIGYAAGGEYGNYWTVMVGCRPHVLPTVTVDGQTYATREQCGDAGAIRPTLHVPQTPIKPGADLEVHWTSIGSPTARDWLGLYRPAEVDTAYRAWTYVSCGWMPLGPRPDGWCWLHVPSDLLPGTYELRLHADDGYTVLAASDPVTVVADSAA